MTGKHGVFSGAHLQFALDILVVRIVPLGEDGELLEPLFLNPGEVQNAREGSDGFVEIDAAVYPGGRKLEGNVTFFREPLPGDMLTGREPLVEQLRRMDLGEDYVPPYKGNRAEDAVIKIPAITDGRYGPVPNVSMNEDAGGSFSPVDNRPLGDAACTVDDVPGTPEPLEVGQKYTIEELRSRLEELRVDQGGTPAPAEAQSVPGGFATQVAKLVGERGSAYGTPAENHGLTADLLSLWLSRKLKTAVRLTGEDVCMINILQKASRLAFVTKDDSWFDIAGYTENVAMLRPDQRNT